MKDCYKWRRFLVVSIIIVGLLYVRYSDNVPGRNFISWKGDIKSPIVRRRQEFLMHAKEDLFHVKAPVFLSKLKNPCLYETTNSTSKTLRCLPYFLLIGQEKCGTTDLFNSIITHPDVTEPQIKESWFWAWNRHCKSAPPLTYRLRCSSNRPKTWRDYAEFFSLAAEQIEDLLSAKVDRSNIQVVTGEGTPSTFWDNRWWWNYPPNVHDKEGPALINADYIHRFLPNVKMICILRNPVDRLYSDYLFLKEKVGSRDQQLFHQKVEHEISLFRDCLKNRSVRHCVYFSNWEKGNNSDGVRMHLGFYSTFIQDWLKRFPRDQFLFLRLEDYSSFKNNTMMKIFKFLGLRDARVHLEDTMLRNRKATKLRVGEMLPKTRRILEDLYRPFNKKLAGILNDRRYLWIEMK